MSLTGAEYKQNPVTLGHKFFRVFLLLSLEGLVQYEASGEYCIQLPDGLLFVFVQHDAQMDYYGKRLATCSSDRTIKIFEVVENTQNLVATLTG